MLEADRHIGQERLRFFVRYANRLICSSAEAFGPRIIHDHQFIYVERGRGSAVITGQHFDVLPGQLYYYGPGEPHLFSADHKDPFVLYGLHFSAYVPSGQEGQYEAGKIVVMDVSQLGEVQPVVGAEPRLPGISACMETEGWPRAYMQEAVAEYRRYDALSPLILQGVVAGLLGHAARIAEKHSRPDTDPQDSHMLHIRLRLKELACDSYDSNWLASWTPYSHDYASRLFRQVYGISPHAYHLTQKLEKARDLLQESNQSVTYIAERLHFNSVHYFSRLFKSRYGESPSQYRNRYRWL